MTLRLMTLCATALAVLLAGCGSPTGTGSPAGATTITVSMTDDGCAPEPATATAGPLTFEVTNDAAKQVTEAEVVQDGRILGEKENLTPGLSGTFTLRLEAGDYEIYCPNAATERSPFTVTAADGPAAAGTADPRLADAVKGYQAYLHDQTAALTASTAKLVAAIKAGDVSAARSLYAPTRAYYERIEPVAESFGDLDPRIDARVNDVDPSQTWTGFHRLEKALWQDDRLTGMDFVADRLLADVRELRVKVRTVSLAPEQIANGAVGLLDEVAKSKITGEEDRYSHTDLWDFAANVDGARKALDVLAPVVEAQDAALLTRINAQFDDVDASLQRYRSADGYRDYSAVTDAERRTMTTQVSALAESLSKVAPLIA